MADNERELFRKKILKLPELNKNGEVVQSSKTGTHVVPSKRLEIETPRPKQDLSNGINQRNALLGTTGFSGKQEEPSTLTKKFKDIYNNLMNKYSKGNNPASQQSFVNNVNSQPNQAQPSLTNKLLENRNIDTENKPVKEVKPDESTKNKAEFILENRQKNLEYEELKKEKESGEANYGFADDFNGEKGNIDINHREILRNSDGSISTEKNIYIEETDENGKPSYVVIPTVVDGIDIDPNGDGNKAYQHYKETGEFLGRFSSEADAEAYSRELSLRQSKFYRKEMSDWRSELYQKQQEEKADLGKFIPLDKGALTNADGGINKENLRKWAETNAATLSDIAKQTLKGAYLDKIDAVQDIMFIASAKILESQGFYKEAEVQYKRAMKDSSEDWVNTIGAAIKTGAEFGRSSFDYNKDYFKNLESKSFLSKSGEGMVQSAASTASKAVTQPILPWQASMAVEVAPRSYLEGKEKGYDEAKSVINAVSDVGIEILTENVGGGFGLKGTGSGSGKYSEIVKQGRRTLKAYLDTASDEGKEEVLGGIMSTVKDYLLENNYDEYSAQQLSQELIQYIAGGDALSDYIGGAGSVLMGDAISRGRSTLRGVRDTQARNQRVIADDTITPETKKTRLEHLDTISESDLLPIQKEALSNRVYDGALDQKGDDKVLKELIKQEEKKTQKIEKAANAIDNEVKKSDLSQEQKNRILSNVDLLKDRDTSIDDQLTKVRTSIEKQQKQNRDIKSRDNKIISSIKRGETTLDKLINESGLTNTQKKLLTKMSNTEGFSTEDVIEQFNKYKRENKVVGKAEQEIKDRHKLLKTNEKNKEKVRIKREELKAKEEYEKSPEGIREKRYNEQLLKTDKQIEEIDRLNNEINKAEKNNDTEKAEELKGQLNDIINKQKQITDPYVEKAREARRIEEEQKKEQRRIKREQNKAKKEKELKDKEEKESSKNIRALVRNVRKNRANVEKQTTTIENKPLLENKQQITQAEGQKAETKTTEQIKQNNQKTETKPKQKQLPASKIKASKYSEQDFRNAMRDLAYGEYAEYNGWGNSREYTSEEIQRNRNIYGILEENGYDYYSDVLGSFDNKKATDKVIERLKKDGIIKAENTKNNNSKPTKEELNELDKQKRKEKQVERQKKKEQEIKKEQSEAQRLLNNRSLPSSEIDNYIPTEQDLKDIDNQKKEERRNKELQRLTEEQEKELKEETYDEETERNIRYKEIEKDDLKNYQNRSNESQRRILNNKEKETEKDYEKLEKLREKLTQRHNKYVEDAFIDKDGNTREDKLNDFFEWMEREKKTTSPTDDQLFSFVKEFNKVRQDEHKALFESSKKAEAEAIQFLEEQKKKNIKEQTKKVEKAEGSLLETKAIAELNEKLEKAEEELQNTNSKSKAEETNTTTNNQTDKPKKSLLVSITKKQLDVFNKEQKERAKTEAQRKSYVNTFLDKAENNTRLKNEFTNLVQEKISNGEEIDNSVDGMYNLIQELNRKREEKNSRTEERVGKFIEESKNTQNINDNTNANANINANKNGKKLNWIETLDQEIMNKFNISEDVWNTFEDSKKWEYRNRQRKNTTNTVSGEIRNSIVENIENQVAEQENNVEENEPDILDILDGKTETKPEETQTTTPEVQLEATPKELWEKYKTEEKESNGENRELYFVDSEGNRISTEDDAFDTYLALATPQDFVRDLKAAVDEANKNNFLETYKVTESVYKKALNTKNEEQLAKNEQIISALASNSITDKFKTLDSLEVYDVVTKDEFYKNFNAKIRTVNGKKVKDKTGKATYSMYLDEKLRRTLYARTGEKYDINDEFTGYEIGNIKKLEITNEINRTSSAHFQKIVEKFTNPETATNGTGIDLFSMKQRHGGLVSRAMMYTASPQRVAELMFDYDTAKAINDEFINPTFKALARKERYIQNIVDRVDKFGIKDGTKDSKLLFQLIEGQKYDDDGNPIGQYTPTMLKEELKGDTERIERITNAARDIKTIYDSIFNAVNDVLYENGFPKIPKRAHYITHMTKKSQDSLNTYIGKVFGNQAQEDRANMLLGIFPDEEVNGEDEEEAKVTDNSSQSNAINNEGIKVQRSSSGFEKARTQKVTETDAIRAVKLYTKSMADIIFLTEHTQKLRAFEKLLRQASNLEVMNEHTKVLDIDSLDTAQQLMFEKLREDKAFKEYADWIDGYVNQLVNIDKYSSEGQKELIDMYNKYVVGSVGKNAVAFNPNTAATNFIPMSTTIALTNPIYSLKAIGDMVSEDIIHKNRKQLFQDSDVWTRRHGANLGVDTENVGKFSKATRKITDVGMALMGFVDDFSTEFTIRAKYNEFVAKNKGKKEFKTEAGNLNEKKLHQAAMEYADDFTSRLLAERSQGTLPEVFNNKALKMFTQFQIEPTNIVLGYMHDAKMREKRAIEEGANPALAKAKTAADLLSMAVSSQVFNNIFESIFGSRPNIDLIEVIKIALGYDDDEEEDNVFKKLFGLNVKKNDNPVSENLGNALGELLSYMPIINQFGENARVPTVGMLEDMFGGYGELGTALTNLAEAKYNGDEEEVSKSKLQLGSVAEGAIKNTAKYALPTGGGIQAARMYDTARTYQKGGNYNAKGQLRYPVQGQDKTPARFAQALLFGRKNMPTAKEYANNGYKALSEKQTNEYNSLENTSYKQYLRFVNADKTNKLGTLLALDTTTSDKWKIFNNSILTEDQSKAAASAISSGLATKKEYMNWYSAAKQQGVNMPSKEKLEKMVENGTSIKSYIKYQKEYNKISKTSLLTSNDSNMNEKDKARILKDGDYSTEEKDKLYESIAGDSKTVETYNMFKRMGNGEQDIDVFLDYVLADKTNTPKENKYDNKNSYYSDKNDKIKNFVNTHELNDTQKAFIKAKHAVALSRAEKQLIQDFANTLDVEEYNQLYGEIISSTLVGVVNNGEGERVTATWLK